MIKINEINVDEVGLIKYEYQKHLGDPEWEEFNLLWVKDPQTLGILDKKNLTSSQWDIIMKSILVDVYADRQSKEGEHVSIPDTDRVLTGDSGDIHTGDGEEPGDNSYTNEEG